jgi:hypothetical protein
VQFEVRRNREGAKSAKEDAKKSRMKELFVLRVRLRDLRAFAVSGVTNGGNRSV